MTATVDKIKQEALKLPVEERAFLADRLLSSLSGEVLTEIDATWVAEAERRHAEYQAGTRKPVPAAEVFDEADRILR
jgi:putative addiction module component (TIGR02574 family)